MIYSGLPATRPLGNPLMDLGCNVEKIGMSLLQRKNLRQYYIQIEIYFSHINDKILIHYNNFTNMEGK